MSDKKQKFSPEDCNYYFKLIKMENDSISSFLGKIVQIILTLPLLINAGAVIALANFFTNGNGQPKQIIYAGSAFLAGTIFGLITIVYGFFISYTLWRYVNKWGPSLGKKIEGDLDALMQQFIEYSNNKPEREKRLLRIMRWGIINSSFSLIFFMAGVYFIAVYILNSYCLAITISVILAAYFIGLLFWLNTQFKVE